MRRERDELRDVVELRKGRVLEKDKTVNLAAGNYIKLSYDTPYAGYSIVYSNKWSILLGGK